MSVCSLDSLEFVCGVPWGRGKPGAPCAGLTGGGGRSRHQYVHSVGCPWVGHLDCVHRGGYLCILLFNWGFPHLGIRLKGMLQIERQIPIRCIWSVISGEAQLTAPCQRELSLRPAAAAHLGCGQVYTLLGDGKRRLLASGL